MGYALFAQQKLVLCGLINTVQMQQLDRSNEQMKLSTNTLTLQSKVSRLQANQADQLAKEYDKLSKYAVSDDKYDEMKKSTLSGKEFEAEFGFSKSELGNMIKKSSIDNKIKIIQQNFESEIDGINAEIKLTSMKENAIEMEVKRLDTRLTALQQQLEKIEEAEGKGIEKATPKFSGIG